MTAEFQQGSRTSGVGPALRVVRAAGLFTAFFALYLFLDWLSYIHPIQPFNVTPWNPQPAVAIALLMLKGQRWLPVVLVVVTTVEFLLRGAPASVIGTLSACIVLSLCYAAIARALVHEFPVSTKLEASRDMLRLVVVVTTGALVTGILYIAALAAHGVGSPEHYLDALLSFWIGDSVGILVALPLILLAHDADRRAQFKAMLKRKETLAQGAAIAIGLWAIFGQDPAQHFKLFYVLFVPLVWAAARFGMPGAALAAALIQSGVMFAIHGTDQPITAFELQGLLIALAITGFFLGVTVDERHRAADELRLSLKLAAAGEMAAALAHELNQPLAALTSYASASQLLLRSPNRNEQQLTDTLDKLVGEAKRAGDVVRRLRDFFRSGARKLETLALPPLIEGVLSSLTARAAAREIEVAYQVVTNIPPVVADRLQIEVVVRNLLVNAFDALAAASMPRRVRISVSADANDVRVAVEDNGPGISPQQMEHLFEPFASTKATGMGVGLAISRAIADAHGGRLWVQHAKEPTVICFSLPIPSQHD